VTCDDYLSLLETLPVEQLSRTLAGSHAATCADCARVTRVVAERERNMVMAFSDVQPYVPAEQTAAGALRASRRRKVALFYQVGLALAGVATVLTIFLSRALPPTQKSVVLAETFRLQCLSPDQAAEVIRPIVGSSGLVSMRPASDLGIITVQTSPEVMQRVRSVLDRSDNPALSQCAVQIRVPKVPTVPEVAPARVR
jgi:hypothetical protein